MIALGRFVALLLISLCASTGAAAAADPAWTTYRHDAGRSGVDPDSTSPVAPAQAWQTTLDGEVYGQPLVYGSTVYVATENDTVFALDAATGAVVWQRHLATAVPATQLPCGNFDTTLGITSTPVLDPSTGVIYVVAETWDGSSLGSIKHELFGVNLSDGTVASGQVVDPPGSTPEYQLQRPGLALDAGKVIIGFGSDGGDCGPYHGWLVAVPEGGGSLQTFEVDPSTNGGAIWGGGNAPPIDSAGDIWTSTGDGSGASFGFQESVIRLDSNLGVLDHWTPDTWSSLDSSDLDIGSSMPVLLPNGLVFQVGKQGVGYLLSASSLGGTGAAPVYQANVCGSYGGGIYVGGVIYVACLEGMHALSLDPNAKTFAPVSEWSINSGAVGPPMFAGGLLWSAGTNDGTLYGLDPSSGSVRFSASLGGFEHFTTPSAGGGRLFVGNKDAVTAFELASPPAPSPTPTPAPSPTPTPAPSPTPTPAPSPTPTPAPSPTPAPTTTRITSSSNPSNAGAQVTFEGLGSPKFDSGTISFAGYEVRACEGTVLSPSNPGFCTTTFPKAGRYTITATYTGSPYYASSTASITQVVVAPPPVISRLKARAVDRRLRLSLAISQPAWLTVKIYRRLGCRARVGHRPCVRLVRKATLTLVARAGRDSFRPRMRPLPSGRYELTVAGVTPAGGHSRTYRTSLAVPRGCHGAARCTRVRVDDHEGWARSPVLDWLADGQIAYAW